MREYRGKGTKNIWLLLLIPFCLQLLDGRAMGCAACVAAGKLARETDNRAFYALRILYEKKGRAALPLFRQALTLDGNPPAQMRAAGYVAELNDAPSIPRLEKILSELFKRVSFSSFGIETVDFRKRWIVAYALGTLGAPEIAERIWGRYDRFSLAKKTEVPQILAALGDPRLTEHLVGIIDECEDHRLIMATLESLAKGGNAEAVSFLRLKIMEWEAKAAVSSGRMDADTGVDYFVLSRKAAQVIPRIEERLGLEEGQPVLREKPGKEEKGTKPAYF